MKIAPRPPARLGIRGDPLSWQSLPRSTLDIAAQSNLKRALASAISVEIDPALDSQFRYLRLRTTETGYFIKWFPTNGYDSELRSFDRSKELLALGASVAEPLWWEQFGKGYIFAYRWCAGDHPDDRSMDFRIAGGALADLHEALAQIKKVSARGLTRGHMTGCVEAARDLAQKNHVLRLGLSSTQSKLMDDAIEVYLEMTGAYIDTGDSIHGDLNPGNMILTANRFTFIDFEETDRMRLARILDVAKIAERLVLPVASNRGMSWAKRSVQSLIAGYCSASLYHSSDFHAEDLALPMKWNLAHGLAVLAAQKLHSEYFVYERDKFLSLLFTLSETGELFRSLR